MKTPAPELLRALQAPHRSVLGLFDGLEDVQFWVKDTAHRYVYANRALLLNYALEDVAEILGRTDYDFSPAFCADQFWFDDEQVLKGRSVSNRIELVGGAGEVPQWFVTNKTPVYSARGGVLGTAGTTRRVERGGQGLAAGGDGGSVSGFDAVLDVIRSRFHNPLSNSELAAAAGTSVRTFERRFRATFQVTPQQYLRKLRIRLACRQLVFSTRTLAEVALESGFADQSHFSHEFRRQMGRTPRAYREHYRGIGPGGR